MAGEAREKCAVGGVLLVDDELNSASTYLYETMFALQHRGTEASGMASKDPDSALEEHRKIGMVSDVYDAESIHKLAGSMAIGHNRYSTSGRKDRHHQPVVDEGLGFALAHNGNIPDTARMDEFLGRHNLLYGHRNDSEKMGFTIAQFMRQGRDLPAAVRGAYPMMEGAFSCVAMHDNMLVAFRDPKGIRPLALGRFNENWVVSSETCGLDILNAKFVRDVLPGEMVVITDDGKLEPEQLVEGTDKFDIFEFVYFARRDSKMMGRTVNGVRRRLGEELAAQHGTTGFDNVDNVVVVPVPDSSKPIADGYARALGLNLSEAIEKNRYIGRTFMQSTQEARVRGLRRKHNIIAEEVKDRDVIMVDDSIVRLNTLPNLVARMKQIGARTVSVLIGCPPIRFPDFYGIDTPKQSELAAANMTTEQMRRAMGNPNRDPNGSDENCRFLGFLSLQRMVNATEMPHDMFNLSCFTGEYSAPIGRHQQDIRTPVSMEYVY